MKSTLIDLTLQLHHETDKAIFVSDDGERDNAVWVPKEPCEIERKEKGIVVVTMPEALATAKGLV